MNAMHQPINHDEKVEDVLRAAAAYFNIGKILTLNPMGGNLNKNYSIKTDKGMEYIAKIVLKGTVEDLENEAVFLERLSQYNFPSPHYLRGVGGLSAFSYRGMSVTMRVRLAGSPPALTKAVCGDIGRNIARLHMIKTDDLPKRNHWLGKQYLSKTIAQIELNFPEISKKFKTAHAVVSHFRHEEFDSVIIHGDLYTSNCLYQDNKITALIDWEEVGLAPAILDLGMCVFNFCFVDDVLRSDYYISMLNEYQKLRKLTDIEVHSITTATQYAALTLSSWRQLQFGLLTPDPAELRKADVYWRVKMGQLKLPPVDN